MTKTILLVEDNPDDEMLTIRALRKSDATNEIVVAHDGAEALEQLFGAPGEAGKPVLPALVLLDLKLPKVDGLEVLRRIRADPRTAVIPVVVLTTSNEQTDLLQSYRLGTNAYVRKPVVFADFVDAIRALGLFWLVVNQNPPADSSGPGQPSRSSAGSGHLS